MLVIVMDHLNAKLLLSLLGRGGGVQEEQPTGRWAPSSRPPSSFPHDSPAGRTDARTRPLSNPIPVQGTEHQDPLPCSHQTRHHTHLWTPVPSSHGCGPLPCLSPHERPTDPLRPDFPDPRSGGADLAREPRISLALACLARCPVSPCKTLISCRPAGGTES